jgi:hypothetical protein
MMPPKWLMRLALLFVLLGIVLLANTGRCAEVSQDTAVAAQLGGLRAEVQGLREQVGRLVQAQVAALERRPIYETDLAQLRENMMREVSPIRAEQDKHHLRLTTLEEGRWYIIGAMAIILGLGGAIWRGMKLNLVVEREKIERERERKASEAPARGQAVDP